MAAVVKSYPGITATGAQPALSAPGSMPFHKFAVQLKGVGGTITSWTLTLEGSLDNTNWTTLITHNATDGSTQWTTEKPVLWVRANLSALSLGTATSVTIGLVAMGV